MKVVLFMATTPNGFIARENGEEDFESKLQFNESQEVGNGIIQLRYSVVK